MDRGDHRPPVGGVDKLSHRLNNQLTVILGRAQRALGSSCDDRMHGDLVAIAEAAQRVTVLLRELFRVTAR